MCSCDISKSWWCMYVCKQHSLEKIKYAKLQVFCPENTFQNVIWNEDHLVRHPRVATFNTLRPNQNGRHFADDIFKCIFLNENAWISSKISLKIVPKGPINKIPALVQIMAWRRSGDKPLSEPMMVSLLTHVCVTRPQWVKWQAVYIQFPALTKWLPWGKSWISQFD